LPNLATLPFSANGHGLSPSMSEETQTMDNSNNTLPGWDAHCPDNAWKRGLQ
jgi:hypothetical protein